MAFYTGYSLQPDACNTYQSRLSIVESLKTTWPIKVVNCDIFFELVSLFDLVGTIDAEDLGFANAGDEWDQETKNRPIW